MRLIFFVLLFCFHSAFSQQASLKLWYRQPANASVLADKNRRKDDPEWLKTLPLGNGNIGAMVFDDVIKERVQLNEKTLWSSCIDDNAKAAKHIPEIKGYA